VSERRGRAFLFGVGRAIRTGWLIWGLTLLVFLGLEFGYRGTSALRSRLSARAAVRDSSRHPYAGQAWWPELRRDLERRRNRFDPYRSHWSLPQTSRYVNIDSLGRRVTPQPRITGPHRQLYLLGGSATWGYTARDSATIGAFLAAELRRRGLEDVEVVNLAQAAFNATQEATTLLVELAHGRTPALAVFVNGYNDAATAGKYGEPGHTYGDEGIQRILDRGHRGFLGDLGGLGDHSAVVERLRSALGLEPAKLAARPPAELCGPVAGYYRSIALAEQSLATTFGFQAVHFLQPHHSVSRKPLTPWEAALPRSRWAACLASLDSAMADQRGATFFSLVDLFDRDSAIVFVDSDAHITEAGNQRVAQRIAEVVAPLLVQPKPATPGLRPASGHRP